MNLKPIKKATSVDVLEELKKQHPIAEELLSYRHFSKLKNTYLDAIPSHINSLTSKVHTSFNQTIAQLEDYLALNQICKTSNKN